MRNVPRPSVTAVATMGPEASTVTPGSGAPDMSLMVPPSEPRSDCAAWPHTNAATTNTTTTRLPMRARMASLLCDRLVVGPPAERVARRVSKARALEWPRVGRARRAGHGEERAQRLQSHGSRDHGA